MSELLNGTKVPPPTVNKVNLFAHIQSNSNSVELNADNIKLLSKTMATLGATCAMLGLKVSIAEAKDKATNKPYVFISNLDELALQIQQVLA